MLLWCGVFCERSVWVGEWIGGGGFRVDPVARPCRDRQFRVVGQRQVDDVEARVWRLRLEAEYVAVGYVVGDGGEAAFEGLCVGEFEVFAAGETGHGLGNVAFETVGRGYRRHFGEGQWRDKLGEAVVGLNGFVVSRVGIRIGVFAHAAARRVGVVVFHP